MSEPEEETKGFKVTDRRKFTPEGDPRPGVVSEKPDPRVETEGRKKPEPVGPSPRRPPAVKPSPDAEAAPSGDEFLHLLSWLATNAFMQLGEIADPVSGQRVENLPGAQEFIGILNVLREKTKGNLTAEESRGLDQVLYELRMRFMAKAGLIKT